MSRKRILSTRDPARFAFAHGGKDGTPFPVDRETYDRTIDVLHRAMARAKVDRSEKLDALRRLGRFAQTTEPRRNGAKKTLCQYAPGRHVPLVEHGRACCRGPGERATLLRSGVRNDLHRLLSRVHEPAFPDAVAKTRADERFAFARVLPTDRANVTRIASHECEIRPCPALFSYGCAVYRPPWLGRLAASSSGARSKFSVPCRTDRRYGGATWRIRAASTRLRKASARRHPSNQRSRKSGLSWFSWAQSTIAGTAPLVQAAKDDIAEMQDVGSNAARTSSFSATAVGRSATTAHRI